MSTKSDKLKKWFEVRVKEVELPTGLIVEIKLSTLQDLVVAGYIPLPITSAYDKAIPTIAGAKTNEEMGAALVDIMPMYDAVCAACMISPKIGEALDIENDVITLDDISIEDKSTIYNAATGGYRLITDFHKESTGSISNNEQSG